MSLFIIIIIIYKEREYAWINVIHAWASKLGCGIR
jgi:hypothetical protein